MTRYIDADKAIQQIRKQSSRSVARECAVNAVNNTPAEDVAPVVHAYWIGGDYGDWFCSECDSVLRFYGDSKHLRYCYRCGAKMDGEVET